MALKREGAYYRIQKTWEEKKMHCMTLVWILTSTVKNIFETIREMSM